MSRTRRRQLVLPDIVLCACGCGAELESTRRLFAGDACRARAYRRRRQGIPIDFVPTASRRGRTNLATLYRSSHQGIADGAQEPRAARQAS